MHWVSKGLSTKLWSGFARYYIEKLLPYKQGVFIEVGSGRLKS